MGQTVAILGGGIGGLSAAHELAERGFEVRVFESKPIFGGKARSIPVPNSAVEGRKLLPGEHGFRFFPGFYRHVHDTMSRIPFRNNPRGVLDNLVPTTRTALARAGAPDMLVCSRFPRDRHDWKTAIRGAFDFVRLIPMRDMVHYVRRLLVWLTSCDERRLHEYEHIPWWEFTQARQPFRGLPAVPRPGLHAADGRHPRRGGQHAHRRRDWTAARSRAADTRRGRRFGAVGSDQRDVDRPVGRAPHAARRGVSARRRGAPDSHRRPAASPTSPSSTKAGWSTSPPTITWRRCRSK